MFSILANGNHCVEVMHQYAFKNQLKAFTNVSARVKAWDWSGKNAKSMAPLQIELGQHCSQLQQVTWVTQILDIGMSFHVFEPCSLML